MAITLSLPLHDFDRIVRDNGLTFVHPERRNAFRDILMVGALLNEDKSALSEVDGLFLEGVLCEAREHKVPIAEDFKTHVCNLEYGDDFLTSQVRADIIVFCFVYFGPDLYASNGRRQSPIAHLPGVWKSAIAKTGARMIANIYEHNELPTGLLCDETEQMMMPRGCGLKGGQGYKMDFALLG